MKTFLDLHYAYGGVMSFAPGELESIVEPVHRFTVYIDGRLGWKGVAYEAPPDCTKSPALLRDLNGIVHSVVKSPDQTWKYCDIGIMADWLLQDGNNLVSDDTPVTCVKCLAGEHEG